MGEILADAHRCVRDCLCPAGCALCALAAPSLPPSPQRVEEGGGVGTEGPVTSATPSSFSNPHPDRACVPLKLFANRPLSHWGGDWGVSSLPPGITAEIGPPVPSSRPRAPAAPSRLQGTGKFGGGGLGRTTPTLRFLPFSYPCTDLELTTLQLSSFSPSNFSGSTFCILHSANNLKTLA